MKHNFRMIGACALIITSTSASANEFNPDISLVLDGVYKTNDTALQNAEKGFSLGHTELTVEAPVDDLFHGRLTAVLEDHEGETELTMEEAFLETTALPYGAQVKAGRFLSTIGYLNGRHTHEDNFSERPAVYRALLGSHYFDDGVQFNVLIPTDFYWKVSAEAFDGKQLAGQSHDKSVGVYTLSTKIGGDLNIENSWQVGASYLHNRLTDLETDSEHEEHDHDPGGHEGHSHDVEYQGKHLYILDAVWKWAPNGNSKEEQLTLSGEYLLAKQPNQYASSDDFQQGWYVSSSYRFQPEWTVSARIGQVDLSEPHGDHFHRQQLDEANLALTWSRSHFSLIRLMYTHQNSDDFEEEGDAVSLQYQLILGAHGAHEF